MTDLARALATSLALLMLAPRSGPDTAMAATAKPPAAGATAATKKSATARKKPAVKTGKKAAKPTAASAGTRKATRKKATRSSKHVRRVPARSASKTSPTAGRTDAAKAAAPFVLSPSNTLRHYKPASPSADDAGTLDLGAVVARFSGWKGVMNLERGPVLTATQGDWLEGMTAYRIVNWATYRQANARGPCGRDPVRWIAVRRMPSPNPSRPATTGIDVALLSEQDIRAFRPDNPTLCLFSTYYDASAPAAAAAKTTARKPTTARKSRGKARTNVKRGSTKRRRAG